MPTTLSAVSTLACAAFVFGAALPCASAAVPPPWTSVGSFAEGLYFNNDSNAVTNTVRDSHADDSVSRVLCVGDVGRPCGATPRPTAPAPPQWHETELHGSSAASQADIDDRSAHVRTRRAGPIPGDIGVRDPRGFATYSATAVAKWTDEIRFDAAVPTVVTFVVRVDVDWSDYGRFAIWGGVPVAGSDAPDTIDRIYSNGVQPGPGVPDPGGGFYAFPYSCLQGCVGIAGDDPLNRSGSVDRTFLFDVLLAPFGWRPDPESPSFVTSNAFELGLGAVSQHEGAVVEAFSSMTVERVVIPQGTSIAFASGRQWLVANDFGTTVAVPEPAPAWAWLTLGAALVGWGRRRQSRVTRMTSSGDVTPAATSRSPSSRIVR